MADKYGYVLANGLETVKLFPLTLTLSPIGGEGIKQGSWQSSLSLCGGERAGVRGAEIRIVTIP